MRGRIVISSFATSVAVLLAIAGPAAAARDTVIATLPAHTPIDALGGHVLWSAPDAAGTGWQLIDYSNGVQRRLPVAPSVAPFDVDLGRGPDGGLVAVYSRCRARLREDGSNFGRRGCDVFRYDLATARERKVGAIGSRRDEYEPTLWRSRIAFVRAYPPRRGRSWVLERMYVRSLREGGPSRRLPGGSAEGGPWDLDLRSRTAAVRWYHEYSEDVRLAFPGRRGRVLLSTPGSGAAAQEYSTLHPTFADAHTVYWGLASSDPDWGEVWRRDVRRRRVEHATTRIGAPFVAFAQDRDISYYALETNPEDETAPLELHRLEELKFERAPKLTLR